MGDFIRTMFNNLPGEFSASNMLNMVDKELGTQIIPPPGEGDFFRWEESPDGGEDVTFFDFKESINRTDPEVIAAEEQILAQNRSDAAAKADLDASLSSLYEEEEKRKRLEGISQMSDNGGFGDPL